MKILAPFLTGILLLAATGPLTSAETPVSEPEIMRSLGSVAGQAVLCNYMAITQVTDLNRSKTYDKAKALELAGMYAAVASAAGQSLTGLIDGGRLNTGNSADIKEIVTINEHLVSLAEASIAHMEAPSPEKQAAYEKIRQKTWKAIAALLGIKE